MVPLIIMSFPKGRNITMLTITCIIIVAGAWVKRYLIVVPTLLHPFMPIQEVPGTWSTYFPNYVEFSITAGCLAGIFFFITLFSKLFPMMAIWEVEEGMKIEHDKQIAIKIRKQREEEEAKITGEQSGIGDETIKQPT
jgi:molybdopterin-containing oxidoreductase family membrane subunit